MSFDRIVPCRSCNAPMRFVYMAKTGRRQPLDAEPNPEKGNLVIIDERHSIARVVTDADADLPRYTSHFATCPDAPTFRKETK